MVKMRMLRMLLLLILVTGMVLLMTTVIAQRLSHHLLARQRRSHQHRPVVQHFRHRVAPSQQHCAAAGTQSRHGVVVGT